MKFNENLTFDDVLMVPQYSEILPREVDLCTSITKNITDSLPILIDKKLDLFSSTVNNK